MALSNDQYYEVMQNYERLQKEDRSDQAARRAKIEALIPALPGYEAAISEAGAALAKARLTGKDGAKEEEKLKELREEKKLLLESAGFTNDDLKIRYHCDRCRDTGYENGKKCSCFKQYEIDLLYKESGLAGQMEKENFETMRSDCYDPSYCVDERNGLYLPEYMTRVKNEVLGFIKEFPERKGNLLFTGPSGVGKTFFTHCTAERMMKMGISVVYATAGELMDTLTAARLNDDPQALARAELIGSSEMLIIDDLGTEPVNSMTNSLLFTCLDGRLKKNQGTVISTNLSMNELRDLYADRICSRIYGNYRIIRFYGEDLRLKKNFFQYIGS